LYAHLFIVLYFFFSSRRRHTRSKRDWSSDVCSSDLEGYNMIGIDYSSDMLAYAEQKAHDKKLPIHWLHQDLRELKGLSNLDAAVSYCDVINYITEDKDLEIVFQRVADSLSNGVLFLFYINSLHHVEINC